MESRLSLALSLVLVGCTAGPPASVAPEAPAVEATPTAEVAPAAEVAPTAEVATDPCRHDEAEDTTRLRYGDFGPAAMAYALLGQAWWQWDSEGHNTDLEDGEVWVVVHQGLSAEALAERFPVDEAARCDHRYVALDDARAYLRTHIDELSDPSVPELAPVRERLEQTLRTLDEHFKP